MLLATLALVIQIPLIPLMDLQRTDIHLISMFGIIGVLFLAASNKLTKIDFILCIPAAALCLLSLPNWVNGWTEYQCAFLVGLTCIVLLSMRAKTVWIMRAMAISVIIQSAVHHFSLIPWANHFPFATDDVWGTFRQHIRYSTIMYAGLVGAWWIAHNRHGWERGAGWAVGSLACFEIVHSNAHIPLACAAVSLAILISARYKNRVAYAAWAVLAIGVGYMLWHGVHTLGWTHGRYPIWPVAAAAICDSWQSIIIGHGAGSWQLWTGAYGLTYLTHPHSSALEMIFCFGFAGFAVTAWAVLGCAVLGMWSPVIMLGFLGLCASTLTNSAMYPEVALLIATFAGQCLKGLHDAVDTVFMAANCRMLSIAPATN
jgi:hypothetical protein